MIINVKKINQDRFKVVVNCKQRSEHIVLLSDFLHKKLTKQKVSKTELIIFSFEFLLKMESNTSILSEFDLSEISKYFPSFYKDTMEWCLNI